MLITIMQPAISQIVRFMTLSDIHLNPFDISKNYPVSSETDNDHNDTNAYYLEVLLDAAAFKASHDSNGTPLDTALIPQFILVSGDLLAHGFKGKFEKNTDPALCGTKLKDCVLKTIDGLVDIIRSRQNGLFTCTPIYFAIGNNDSNVDNYLVDKSFLNDLGRRFYEYAHPCNQDTTEKNQFATSFQQNNGAYGVLDLANTPGFNMVVLNTVLYSNKGADLKCMDNKQVVDCKQLRDQQNNFIQTYVKNHSPISLVLLHIPPYDANAGFDTNLKPKLDNTLFSAKSYTIAGHWHLFAPLGNGIKGVMLNSITYRKQANQVRPVPGFMIFEYQASGIRPKLHCELIKLDKMMGNTLLPLPLRCESLN